MGHMSPNIGERNLDLSVFRDEQEREAEEKLQLAAIRDDIDEFLEELGLA